MFEKLRGLLSTKKREGQGLGWKNWVAYVLFGAIIVVFALFGVTPSQFGDSAGGGVAAVVNESSISLAEYRTRVESVEQNARMRFDQFPEAQRRQLAAEMRRRALEELILGEVVYQAADRKGIIASDGEVRDAILQIEFLKENGRFMRDRYRAFLQNQNLTSEDFERTVRKQIVTQKLQELFVGSATPTREELRRNRILADQKVNLRFAELDRTEMSKLVTEEEVRNFAAAQKAEVEKYYNDNKIEFSSPEKVKARHILVRLDKRGDAEAMKIAADLRKQATAKNFSDLAKKHSEDPGSKDKGGDLGEFERGRMTPEFEQAAFSLKAGEISDPIKTPFGYHVILVDQKVDAHTKPLEQVSNEIARKLALRAKETELKAELTKLAQSGNRKDLEARLSRAGVKWQESGEFDLSTSSIPKLGDNPSLITAILKQGQKGGLIPQAIDGKSGLIFAEVLSWKQVPDKNPDVDGISRMVAFRKSADPIETWAKDVEAKATIQRNPRLFQ